MLRSMKALLGFSRHAACNWQLEWFSDVSDDAILLLLFFLRAGFVERQETILYAGELIWSFCQASDADKLSLIPYAEYSAFTVFCKPSCVGQGIGVVFLLVQCCPQVGQSNLNIHCYLTKALHCHSVLTNCADFMQWQSFLLFCPLCMSSLCCLVLSTNESDHKTGHPGYRAVQLRPTSQLSVRTQTCTRPLKAPRCSLTAKSKHNGTQLEDIFRKIFWGCLAILSLYPHFWFDSSFLVTVHFVTLDNNAGRSD